MILHWLSVCLFVYLTSICLSIFSFLDHNLNECQWIFTKCGMCIDIVEIWFGIANGQISSLFIRLFEKWDVLCYRVWRPSICIYARYFGRSAFVLVSGLLCHCGVKNCVVGLTDRLKW